jgi:drug/metabolite transporter (DMT)-like permease
MHSPNEAPASRQRLFGYLLLASGMGLVGTYVALSRPLTEVFPVFLLAWLRFAIAALAMVPWLVRPPGEPPATRSTWKTLFVLSFFGNFLFSILMLNGVALAGASAAGVVLAAMPALVAVLSWWLLGERASARIWLAIGLAMIGMVLLAMAGGPGGSDTATSGWSSGMGGAASLAGPLLLFGCAICEALYVVLGKRLSGVMSAKRISALINLFGLALMTPFGLWQALDFDWATVNASMWALLVFYSLAASMIATWLWLSGLRYVPASHSGVFALALPLAASAVGIFALGEALTLALGMAVLCACAGVVLVASPGRKTG